MKQYIDKADLVAEIERLIDSHKPLKTLDPTYCEGLNDSLNNILSFLDTLEVKEIGADLGDPQGDIGVNWVQEEPVSNDLEEAVNAYIGYAPEVDECSSVYGKRQAFKAGAQWQKEQMVEEACKWLELHDSYAVPTNIKVRDLKEHLSSK